jgi:transposase
MKAYSLDLRERIVGARIKGESVASVAQRFGVCTKTVRVYEKRASQGRLSVTPRPGRARRLSEADHAE